MTYRRVRGDAIETFKYLHGIYKVDHNDILPRHTDTGISTRGHTLPVFPFCDGHVTHVKTGTDRVTVKLGTGGIRYGISTYRCPFTSVKLASHSLSLSLWQAEPP
jgi:hypothetical protein